MCEHKRRREQVWEEIAIMRKGRRRMIRDTNEKLSAQKNSAKKNEKK